MTNIRHIRKTIIAIIFLFLVCFIKTFGNEYYLADDYEKGYRLISEKPDSALIILGETYEKAKVQKDTLIMIKSLFYMADVNYSKMDYPSSLGYITEALFLAERCNYLGEMAYILDLMGQLYISFGIREIGRSYILKSHETKLRCVEEEILPAKDLIISYLNLAYLERDDTNYSKAIKYLDTCFVISDSLNQPYIYRASLLNQKANLLILTGEPDKALSILFPLEKYFEDIIERKGKYTKETDILIFVETFIGDAFEKKGDLSNALLYYNKAFKLIDHYQAHNTQKTYLLIKISEIQQKQGNYELAYIYRKEAHILSDLYYSTKSLQNAAVLTLKDSYREELKRKEKELLKQKHQLANKQNTILRFRLLVLFFIFLIGLSIMVVRNRVQKIKHQSENEINRQRILDKERWAKTMIEFKNKELTSYTLQLIERDDLLDKFSTHIKSHNSSPEKHSLLHERKKLSKNSWEEFNQRFVSVNEAFYIKLQEQFPKLTQTDLKHCALIKLNFSGKKMANLLNISETSVHMARYRIRKKLGIATDVNLTSFLEGI